jgi:hypothetical protein
MTNDRFAYHVALSFAQEGRAVAEKLANLLAARNIKALMAEAQFVEVGGSDFVTHVAELFRTKARYCVLIISEDYPLKAWTEKEQTFAREHALRDAGEYILALRLDDRGVLAETAGPAALEDIVDRLEDKLSQAEVRSSPPASSHDLRSGNIPEQNHGSDDG